MHRVRRQSQRREAAEAEGKLFKFYRDAKTGRGVEEDAMPWLNSCSDLSSPVARTQRQNLTCVL